MKILLFILVALSVIVLSYFLMRYRRGPCPWWLAFLLENRFVESAPGTMVIVDRLGLREGMRVVDIGCGPGRLTVPTAQRVGSSGQVVALDMQKEMLRKLQNRLDGQKISNVRTLHGGIGQSLLERNYFDRALLVTVLGEIRDKKSALQEIFSALKPGGVLSVNEMLVDPDYQPRKTVRRLAEAAGFRLDREFGNWWAFTINFVKPTE